MVGTPTAFSGGGGALRGSYGPLRGPLTCADDKTEDGGISSDGAPE